MSSKPPWSTLVFHQGMLAILHEGGLTTRAPYVATPTWPLHVPAFVSLAFCGGVWALEVVALSLLVNGAWGLGVALASLKR